MKRERLKQLWKRLTDKLPPYTRKGRVIRNLVVIVLLALLCWTLLDAPALTTEWKYRRMERRNLVDRGEIITIKDIALPHWPEYEDCHLVVAENEDKYITCMPESHDSLECWDKKEVTLASVEPPGPTDPWAVTPLILITRLPAVRAEVEFTLPPELNWSLSKYEQHLPEPYMGFVCQGTAEGDNGVFVFSLLEERPESGEWDAEKMMWQLERDALSIFVHILRGIENDYDVEIPVTIRLWDGENNLIYDEVQTYRAERGGRR